MFKNRRSKWYVGVMVVLLALMMVVAACGGSTPPANEGSTGSTGNTGNTGNTGGSGGQTPPAEKTLTVGMWSAPGNFSPINADSSYAYYIVDLVFDSLVSMTPDLEYTPRLAESWDVNDDSTEFTFHLYPDAKWHDGEPVTANDVAFTVQTIANPKVETNRGANLGPLVGLNASGKTDDGGPVSGVEVIDEHTIKFTTVKPVDPNMLFEKLANGIYIIPEHLLKDVAPEDLSKADALTNNLVGSGPFKFVQYKTDQYVELAKNVDYPVAEPKLDKIIVRIVSPTSMVAAMKTDDIDMGAGQGIGEIPLQDWPTVQQMDNVNAVSFPAIGYQYMLINNQKYTDPQVRQAIVMSINRQLIVDQLLQGNGTLSFGPISPVVKNYFADDLEPLPYDEAKATQILADAGLAGTEVVLLVPTGNQIREQSANIIQANLQAVGFKVNVQKVDFPTLMSRSAAGDFDFGLIGWSDTFDPDVASQYHTGGQYNFELYSNARVDELLEQGVQTPVLEERQQIYHEIQQLFVQDPPVVFLYFSNVLEAVNKRVVGFEPWAKSSPELSWEWDVKTE